MNEEIIETVAKTSLVNAKTVLWTVASAAFAVLAVVSNWKRDHALTDTLNAIAAETVVIEGPAE